MTDSVNGAQASTSSRDVKQGFVHKLPTSMAKDSSDLFDRLRARRTSLSEMGQHVLKQLAKNSVSRLSEIPAANSVINMTTNNQISSNNSSTLQVPNRANQLFRQQLPGITKKILGKRFNSVNKLANLVMPAGTFDKVSDQILELLADFASTVSAADHIIDEAGVKTLAELQSDTGRSGRLARALNEKNRYIGMAQGAVSGATGVAGAAADIPLSMILALRAIYLTGRAYGFELDKPQDRAMIFEALSNADLSLITEKQAILIGLNSVSGMLGTGNIQGLQAMLGSSNDFEPLFKLLSDSNGQLKWRISAALLDKVTPVIGGAVGAIYTSRLLKEVGESAKQVFEHARQQNGVTAQVGQGTTEPANQQPLAADVKPADSQSTPATTSQATSKKEVQPELMHNDDITKVEISNRREHDAQQADESAKDEQIHDKLAALADEMIDHDSSEPAKDKASQTETNPSSQVQDGGKKTRAEQGETDKKPVRSRTSKTSANTAKDGAAVDSAKATATKAGVAKRSDSKNTEEKAKPANRTTSKTTNAATKSSATLNNTQASTDTKH